MKNSILYNQLRLAFAPISAYSFAIEKKYTHFKKLLEFSHLYIIAQRKEICFKHIKYLENPASISFEIHQIGLENILKCHLPLFQKTWLMILKKK